MQFKINFLSLSFLLISFSILAQAENSSVSGRVTLAGSDEPVPFFNIVIEDSSLGTLTDDQGYYELRDIPPGSHRLVAMALGYTSETVELTISGSEQKTIHFEVEEDAVELKGIVISASPTASGFRYQSDMGFFGESLQKIGEPSFGEMLDGEPGIAMRSNGSAPARPVIRGMDGDRILVLEHGERMGDVSESGSGHSLTMDPLSANRVEVVKGPASLMYGSSALGGVINLMTADIPEDWESGSTGVVSGQGATMNNMGAGFARYTHGTSNWAATGRLAIRETGNIRTPEGPMPGTYMDNYDAAVGFGLQGQDRKGGLSLSANNQAYGLPEHIDDPDESIEVRQQRYGLQGRFAAERNGFFDKLQWRFSATHLDQKEIEIETEAGETHEDIELSHDKYAYSSTLTLQHHPAGIFDRGALGLNFYGHDMDIGGDEAYTPGERRNNLGIFTYQEIPLAPRLRLQAGARADIHATSALPNDVFPEADKSRSSLNLTGSAGINYRPVTGLEIGGQFARSHRNPMVEEIFADGPHLCSGVYELGNVDIEDEIGHGGDLFVQWQSEKVYVEMALFYNRYKNYIIFEPTGEEDPGSSLPVYEYTGDKARFLGGEFVSKLQLTDRINFEFSADYVDARRTAGDQDYLPFIPPLRLRGKLEYSYENGWVGATVRSVTEQDKVAPNENTTDGYNLLGMNAGYRIDYHGRHVLILRVDNVFDQKYRDHLSRVEDRQFPMPGRNISLAYRFYFH